MIDLRELEIKELTEFENSPFQFREDTSFHLLVDSIKINGVISPIQIAILWAITILTAIMYALGQTER